MTNTSNAVEVKPINNPDGFTPDPVYRLMGIYEDSSKGVPAAEAIGQAGFVADDIELFCGVKGEQTYDFSGDDHGPFAKFMRTFRNITFDRVIMERYQNALREGHCVLMVYIHKQEQKIDASRIMEETGASQIDYFGLAATEASPHKQTERKDPDATF